jgi:NDP-sugar pyrophosphorylase family protein
MRAVILAGGKGTRLAPYTNVLPKPLVPVGDRPMIELIIRQLAQAGFDRIDLCVGHLGQLIRAYLTESAVVPEGVEINYVWEDSPLGTAGALHLIERPTEPFLVMNGDVLTTLPYGQLMRFHEASGAELTIASHQQAVRISLGVIEGERGEVSGYVEKPTLQYEVSMGIYVYDPGVIDLIPRGPFDFPNVVLLLIEAAKRVQTYHFDGMWFDIGTPAEHERAMEAYADDPSRFDPSR